MADDNEDLERRIAETEEQIANAESAAERARERLEELKGSRHRGPSMEEFEKMSSMERRELKEDSPEVWRDLIDRKRQRGEDALRETSSSGFLGV